MEAARTVKDVSPHEFVKAYAAHLKRSGHPNFRVQPWAMMTKLRPFVHTFLKEASAMFELHICTMGERDYASKMVEFLDPEKVYFKSRVIAREDLIDSEEKSLDLVPRHKRMAIILDDNQHVWKHDQSNLILVQKYFYFNSKSAKSIASFSALNTDEDETTGVLATILEKLKLIHRLFFNPKSKGGLVHRDVRSILANLRVLQGCKLTFKGNFPRV
ncbi:rna polymerase ii c-terminal domain phosphatase-like 4 [Quercus suber]|uniref:protein-serine/threonine phosphatase n=1 Tax=Quercus suber TaxID=58331 RepID=A0AAW0KHX3_QUESU